MTQQEAINNIIQMLGKAIVLLTAIPIHEVAHGITAYWLGDPTAKNAGRLTLNPFKHFDLMGTIALFLVGIGWAKPVPINSRYFKKPKRDIAIVSFAGPFANLVMAYISTIFYRFFRNLFYATSNSNDLLYYCAMVFSYSVSINIILMIFNLLPIPPNDGFKIVGSFLPERIYYSLLKYERYGMIIIVILVFAGFLSTPLSVAQNAVFDVLFTLTGFVDRIIQMIIGLL